MLGVGAHLSVLSLVSGVEACRIDVGIYTQALWMWGLACGAEGCTAALRLV